METVKRWRGERRDWREFASATGADRARVRQALAPLSSPAIWMVAELSPEFLPQLATEVAPFCRRHAPPLFSQFLSPARGERTEPLTGVTNGLPPFRRQPSKLLEPLPETLPFVRLHLLPLTEPLLSLIALVGIHVRPSSGSASKTFLPLCRHLVPVLVEPLQYPLLVLVQLIPWNP